MNLTEMIDGVIERGGNGEHVLNMLIEFGHVPPDANTRPAEMTAGQCAYAASMEYGPEYQEGILSIEGALIPIIAALVGKECQVGVQVAPDGRVWVCVNGASFLRFKPNREGGPGMGPNHKIRD